MKRMEVFAALALALAGAMSAQVATQANTQYQTEKGRKALAAECGTLLTEDLQHGRAIRGMEIRNPFL